MNLWKASGSPPLAFLCALALGVAAFASLARVQRTRLAISSPSSHLPHWYIRGRVVNCCNCNPTSFPI